MKNVLGRYTNSTLQTVSAGGNILFTDNTFSCDTLGYDNLGGIQIKKPGTYMIHSNFFDIATSIGNNIIEIKESSGVIPYGMAGYTAATIGDYNTVGIDIIITVKPTFTKEYATLTFTPTVGTSIRNAVVIIKEVV